MTMLTRLKLIIGALLIGMILSPTAAKAHGYDGTAITIFSGMIGYQLGKQAAQPVVIYQDVPTVYPSAPVIIENPGAGVQGYCGAYKGELYYQCLGNLQRQRNFEAYQRGLRGY